MSAITMRVIGFVWLLVAAMNLSVVILAVQADDNWLRPLATLGAQACAGIYAFWIADLLDERARRWLR